MNGYFIISRSTDIDKKTTYSDNEITESERGNS